MDFHFSNIVSEKANFKKISIGIQVKLTITVIILMFLLLIIYKIINNYFLGIIFNSIVLNIILITFFISLIIFGTYIIIGVIVKRPLHKLDYLAENCSKNYLIDKVDININDELNERINVNNEIILEIQKLLGYTNYLSDYVNNICDIMKNGEKTFIKTTEQIYTIQKNYNQISKILKELNNDSTKIEDITDVVNNLSTQINSLSLKATIDDAKREKSKKGYSVVAEQIRHLSNESINSISKTTNLIINIKNMIDNLAVYIGKSKNNIEIEIKNTVEIEKKFYLIHQSIENLTKHVGDLSSYSEEMTRIVHENSNKSKQI